MKKTKRQLRAMYAKQVKNAPKGAILTYDWELEVMKVDIQK